MREENILQVVASTEKMRPDALALFADHLEAMADNYSSGALTASPDNLRASDKAAAAK